MSKSKSSKPDVVNVGIPVREHEEMGVFAKEQGLRLKQVPSVLWRAFKTLPPEEQESTVKEFRRSLVNA